ncbi:MAG TPA: hypothetical protein VGX68_04145 [Thermoanaerobaculia bacterium]|nr:hypothetical protein [Thermoanaerobaculia bacterium]
MPIHVLPIRARAIALILAAVLLAAAGMAVVATRSTTSNANAAELIAKTTFTDNWQAVT